ncbi:hypothetical protein K1719_027576 [Acacia pycnantha]|nr:hypothetical protein K1719_027576 [Acacia pycnantha]
MYPVKRHQLREREAFNFTVEQKNNFGFCSFCTGFSERQFSGGETRSASRKGPWSIRADKQDHRRRDHRLFELGIAGEATWNPSVDPHAVILRANQAMRAYCNAHATPTTEAAPDKAFKAPSFWVPPPEGTLKINVDGAFHTSTQRAAIAVICRNHWAKITLEASNQSFKPRLIRRARPHNKLKIEDWSKLRRHPRWRKVLGPGCWSIGGKIESDLPNGLPNGFPNGLIS